MNESPIAAPLLAWHVQHGRHDLPWQRDLTPYRVWISEVMLQQTQVATVIPYYQQFMARFPDVQSLAAAPLDDVLHRWAGLGYYSRARNLHRAAQRVVAEFGEVVPASMKALASLPGIGRSTAAAILSLTGSGRHAILDGNVKRVLARYFAVEGSPASAAAQRVLWELAERCTPQSQVAAYTQAVMDLGAMICVRSRPLCNGCPLQEGCRAWRTGRQHELPTRKPRAARRLRQAVMLVAQRRDGSVLLERRPERGIWGGLWCLPEFYSLDAARLYAAGQLQHAAFEPEARGVVRHAFTHFDLEITPYIAHCEGPGAVMEGTATLWYNARSPAPVGLPVPVQIILRSLRTPS